MSDQTYIHPVDERAAKVRAGEPLNSPSQVETSVWAALEVPTGGHTIWFEGPNDPRRAIYDRNPDAWAARYFGFKSAEQYREWVATCGTAYCGAISQTTGKPCGNVVSHIQLEPGVWRDTHRQRLCKVHRHE